MYTKSRIRPFSTRAARTVLGNMSERCSVRSVLRVLRLCGGDARWCGLTRVRFVGACLRAWNEKAGATVARNLIGFQMRLTVSEEIEEGERKPMCVYVVWLLLSAMLVLLSDASAAAGLLVESHLCRATRTPTARRVVRKPKAYHR